LSAKSKVTGFAVRFIVRRARIAMEVAVDFMVLIIGRFVGLGF
jgi:hypothetical protein